jgi:hypothetical protein
MPRELEALCHLAVRWKHRWRDGGLVGLHWQVDDFDCSTYIIQIAQPTAVFTSTFNSSSISIITALHAEGAVIIADHLPHLVTSAIPRNKKGKKRKGANANTAGKWAAPVAEEPLVVYPGLGQLQLSDSPAGRTNDNHCMTFPLGAFVISS